jgi:hypothetical protein
MRTVRITNARVSKNPMSLMRGAGGHGVTHGSTHPVVGHEKEAPRKSGGAISRMIENKAKQAAYRKGTRKLLEEEFTNPPIGGVRGRKFGMEQGLRIEKAAKNPPVKGESRAVRVYRELFVKAKSKGYR